jgi:TRAP-type transport system small permease protein
MISPTVNNQALAPGLAPPAAPAPTHADWQAAQPWLVRAVAKLVDTSVVLIGASLIALVFLNVVLHLFGKDLAWVTELGELLMVWVSFLGGVSAAYRGAHMVINEFLDKLSEPKRRWADAAILLACAALLVVLLVYGWRVVASSWGSQLTTLEWPIAWQYMPLPLGAGLMLFFVLFDLWRALRGVPRNLRYPQD